MEVVINDLEDLKKYIKVRKDKKEILLKFDSVVFNCALPSKGDFNYFQIDNIEDYTFSINSKSIVFNYFASCDNIYASEVEVKAALFCRLLNVIGEVKGGCISTDVFIGINISVNRLAVRKITCKNIQAVLLTIGSENYPYIKADGINNIGVV